MEKWVWWQSILRKAKSANPARSEQGHLTLALFSHSDEAKLSLPIALPTQDMLDSSKSERKMKQQKYPWLRLSTGGCADMISYSTQ